MSTERGRGTVMVIDGTDAVESSMAFALIENSLVGEIILVDIAEERVESEAMNLDHGAYFTSPVRMRTGDYKDCQNADVIIVTAEASQKPDKTRLDLMEWNVGILADAISQITKELNDDAVMLIVANPIGVPPCVTWKASDLPVGRVIGSRTVLDVLRFRCSPSCEFDLDSANIHTHIAGEHGDSEILVWSSADLGGTPFESYATNHGVDDIDVLKAHVEEEVREAVYEITERKKRADHGVARSVAAAIERILGGGNSIPTVLMLVLGEYGIGDAYMSLPCTVDQSGVCGVHEFDLSTDETAAPQESAGVICESTDRLDLQ